MKGIILADGSGSRLYPLTKVTKLGSGSEWGVRLTYEIQDEAGGIAQALALTEDFADDEDAAVILGDNIFQDNVRDAVQSFNSGACIFLKAVADATRFGVAEVDESSGRVLCIEEKSVHVCLCGG